MRRTGVAVALVTLLIGSVAGGVAQAEHNCTREEPRCVGHRTLYVGDAERELTSPRLGHHCGDTEEDKKTRLYHRIGAVFRDVSETHGYLKEIKFYFDGPGPQRLDRLVAYGVRNDFQAGGEKHDEGVVIGFRVEKRVEFRRHGRDGIIAIYLIRTDTSKRAGHDARPAPGLPGENYYVDCGDQHHLQVEVAARPPRNNCPGAPPGASCP
jgi:hypothetical protein